MTTAMGRAMSDLDYDASPVDVNALTLAVIEAFLATRVGSVANELDARAVAEHLAASSALLDLAQHAEEAEARHRDLVSRLGFGNNITEPMADNDTVVAWFEEQGREASEWRESQLWRNDCYAAGHPDDEDCYEHDPTLRAEADRAAVERVRALADEWERRGSILPANQLGKPHTPAMKQAVDRLRAALDPAPAAEVRDDVPHDHPAPATEDHPSIEDARLRRAIARHVCNVSNLPEPLRVAAWGLDFGDFIDGLAAAIRAHLAEHERQAKAEAWQEGYEDGSDDTFATRNPYRDAEEGE